MRSVLDGKSAQYGALSEGVGAAIKARAVLDGCAAGPPGHRGARQRVVRTAVRGGAASRRSAPMRMRASGSKRWKGWSWRSARRPMPRRSRTCRDALPPRKRCSATNRRARDAVPGGAGGAVGAGGGTARGGDRRAREVRGPVPPGAAGVAEDAGVLFEQFWQWLADRLADYVSVNVALVAAALEPAAVSLAASTSWRGGSCTCAARSRNRC